MGAFSLYHVYRGERVPPDHPPSWQALPARPAPVEFVEFLTEGSTAGLGVPGEYLLPAEEVIQIAASLAAHRTPPRTHVWQAAVGRGTLIRLGRDRAWEDWDKPLAPPPPVIDFLS